MPIFVLTILGRVYAPVVSFAGLGWYPTYLVPGCVLMAAMLASGTAGVTTAIDQQTRFYDRLRISPLGATYADLGRRLADATRFAAFAFILLAVSILNGTTVESWPLAIALSLGFAVFWGLAYGGLSFSICLRTGSAEISQALIPLFFPILFTSSAVMPPKLLPEWLSEVARYNPVTYISDAMREGMAGNIDGYAIALALAGIVLTAAVTQSLIWGARRHVSAR
jgi:ABC-2 type transport system permease protein